ncbi:MAG: ABC transporter permease [Gammaproteobacteria bacterium]|nr:ABC transporter permease [Gammaproteobacteria bacterium]
MAFGFFLLGAWELVCRGLAISDLVVPAPTQVLVALYQGFETGQLWYATLVTLKEVVLGFSLSAFAALLLGTLISQIRIVEVMIYPYIVALQTLPKIALAPMILVWFGVGIESKIFIAAMVSFFPMLVNNIVGFRSAPEEKIDLMRSLSASKAKIFLIIKLPEALPYIFAGLNIGIVLSVLGAIVGEFIGAKEGLGYQILQMNYNLDTPGVFAALVVLGIMGVGLNLLAQFARRRVIFWRTDSQVEGSA